MRDHDEQLRRYLLGKLETEERSRLEESLIRDEDLFETAEAVEADLLDDYAHDQLTAEERELVAHRLASSPRGRSRLAVIRGLGRIADEKKNVIEFPQVRRKLSPFERAAAIAAMLAVAILGPWLAIQTAAPVRPPQVAGDPIPAPPAPERRPVPPIAAPLPPGDVIAESTPLPETPAPQPAAPLVIQLALTTFRGEETIPQRNVPPDTGRVQLHLLLDEADKAGFASFQVTVRGAGPELRVEGLEPGEVGGRWTLVLELDPKLPEGMYEVDVQGVTAAGDIEPIAAKELEIQRNASATAVTPD